MNACTNQQQLVVDFDETLGGVTLAEGSNGVLVTAASGTADPLPVTIFESEGSGQAQYFVWSNIEYDQALSLGISFDGSGEVFGADLRNIFYLHSGHVVENGVSIDVVPQLQSGDEVVLLFDPVGMQYAWYHNGVQVK